MIINLIIYGSIFIYTYSRLIGIIQQWTGINVSSVTIWTQALHILLLILGILLILLICYFAFVIFGGIITAPFNENISKFVEQNVYGYKTEELSFWKDTYISIKIEIQKLLFYFTGLFIFILINLIPIAGNVVSVTLGTVFSFFYNALDFLDYPLTRQLASFRTKLEAAQSGGMVTYGFGAMAFLMMFLPIINVFMKPLLVVAGTRLYYEKNFSNLSDIK
jgi:CysZ protein